MHNNNIGIDARPLEGNVSGIGRFLLDTIQSIINSNKNINLFLFSHCKIDIPESIDARRIRNVVLPGNKFLYDIFLPFYVRKYKIESYLGYNQSIPLWGAKKRILYIYDMGVYIVPETFSLKWRLYIKFWIILSAKLADKIITISHTSKNDIKSILKVKDDKIIVVYPWYANRFQALAQNIPFRNKKIVQINKPYILFVGTIKKRKNIERLLIGFQQLIHEHTINVDIVLAGKIAGGKEAVDIPSDPRLQERIHFLGYVNDEELDYLYRNAKLFVYPSLYEGFGIPILEAMSYGLPVLASNVGSIKEIIEDAGLLFDPTNTAEIATGFYSLLKNEDNITQIIIKAGYKRLKYFDKSISEEILQKLFN